MSGPTEAHQVELQTWSVFCRSLHFASYSENLKNTYVEGFSKCMFLFKKRVFCTKVPTEKKFHAEIGKKQFF